MVENGDLGLSLSLSFPTEQHHHSQISGGIGIGIGIHQPLQLNLMPNSSPSPFNLLHKSPWFTHDHSSFPSSSDRNQDMFKVETRSFLKGIDVNRLPATATDAEEEAGVSSPNSTISSVSGKRSVSEREAAVGCDDLDNSSGGLSDGEDGDNGRKKLRLSKDQSAVLEESFKEHNTLNPKQKLALAKKLGLRPRQVEVWFQNRRARTKLKQTEVDCEFLKRCCENLTDDNRRLQKEVQELRALKLSPQFYMQMTPPTTLTMCPSCERVAVPPPSASGGSIAAKPINQMHPHPMTPNHHRPITFNPWANAPVQHRSFDVLRPRS